MKEDRYKSFNAITTDGKEIVIALPHDMTAFAANKYIQYLKSSLHFTPLRLNHNSWTQIMNT